jgi:glycosyltransferase involved in cell wall biosynthesis
VRVVMYVLNDVTRDSRVLREAGTLAAAGHRVTIMGTARSPDEQDGSREERDGFEIVRVGIPRDRALRRFVRMPWRSVRDAAGQIRDALRARPPRLGRATILVLGIVVSLPWVLLRAAWVAVVNRALRRPVSIGGLDYITAWRGETLGWGRRALAHAPVGEVHHAHDMEALPTAARGARRDGARLVYDSHEIFGTWGATLAQPRWLRWAMIRWERRLARRAVAVVTINESIAAELRRRLGVRRVVVVHNCPARWTPPPVPEDRIRVATNIPADEPVVLCHGGFQAGRGLDETAAAMLQPGLERAHLVFLGYRGHVIDPILADGRLKGRAHYMPAVEPAEVVPWVAGADVDVMAILPVDRNSVLSTPNKLFESLAAGVPVVTSDLPERRRIVLDDADGPLGAVCDPADPASIATAIRWVLDQPPEERLALRARCLRAAHERWNWETESAGLLALYAGLSVGP